MTDITYIRTYEGWLSLAVVIDLYSRAVVGWSMKKSLETKIILDALTMAKWRRKPVGKSLSTRTRVVNLVVMNLIAGAKTIV